jgi:hypothetical protein
MLTTRVCDAVWVRARAWCVFRWWCFLSRAVCVSVVVFGRQSERETDGTAKDYFEFGGLTVARGIYIYICRGAR